jgi:uncharacterized protein (UPF0333 family)
MKTIRIMLTLIIIFLALSNTTLSQTDKQISDAVSTLKQKLLLTDSQEKQISGILTQVSKDISAKPENKDNLVKDAQSKVESLLDKKQKMKYDIIKNDFWKNLFG